MEIAGAKPAELIDRYYASWRDGIATFDEAGARGVLADNLDFEDRSPESARARLVLSEASGALSKGCVRQFISFNRSIQAIRPP